MKLRSFEKAHRIAARHRELVGKQPLFAKKSEDRGVVRIYEVIGEDWWTGGGVTAKKIAEALDALKGVKALDIFINSEGGDVFEAKAIYTSFLRFSGEKVVHVDGIAASAASFIAMAGDRIVTSPAATWMIHEARAIAMGRAQDMRAMGDLLDMENRTIADTYATRTKGDVDEILGWMNAETWMNAEEAKKRGFTDEIAEYGDEDEADEKKAAAAAVTPIVALESQTRERSRLARQEHRIQTLKSSFSGEPEKSARSASRQRTNNAVPEGRPAP